MDTFKDYITIRGYTISWYKTTSRCITTFLKYALEHQITVESITHKQLKTFEEYLQEKPHYLTKQPLSSSYINQHFAALSLYFEYLLVRNEVDKNPLKTYHYVKTSNKVREILTQAEIKQVYEYATKPKDKAILALAYGCGLRRAEIIQLNVEDIDFNKGEIWVMGKGKKHTTVPMTHKVGNDIRTYIERTKWRRKSDGKTQQKPVILNRHGEREVGEGCNLAIKRLVAKAGINKTITLHSLRSSIATHLLECGLSIEEVAVFLRHNHIDTTQIYTQHYNTRIQHDSIRIPE